MTAVVAYDVYEEKIWEVKQNNKKIGFLQITSRGYTLKTKNRREQFRTLQDLQARYSLTFNRKIEKTLNIQPCVVYDYPCDVKPYNEIWDISNGIPLYTKSKKSKSYFCAGYYGLVDGNIIKILFCPKKITLHRNVYHGPFKTTHELKKKQSK